MTLFSHTNTASKPFTFRTFFIKLPTYLQTKIISDNIYIIDSLNTYFIKEKGGGVLATQENHASLRFINPWKETQTFWEMKNNKENNRINSPTLSAT